MYFGWKAQQQKQPERREKYIRRGEKIASPKQHIKHIIISITFVVPRQLRVNVRMVKTTTISSLCFSVFFSFSFIHFYNEAERLLCEQAPTMQHISTSFFCGKVLHNCKVHICSRKHMYCIRKNCREMMGSAAAASAATAK